MLECARDIAQAKRTVLARITVASTFSLTNRMDDSMTALRSWDGPCIQLKDIGLVPKPSHSHRQHDALGRVFVISMSVR